MKIKQIKANSHAHGGVRALSSVAFIVTHYSGNKGDTAENNGIYFRDSNTRSAGAHFFVGQDGSIVQSVAMNLTAWSVGGKYGSGAPYYGKCTNANSVSIELCDNADRAPSTAQTQAVKELVAYIRKSCPNAKTIVRHWDVNFKSCPGPYLLNDTNWRAFVKKIGGTASSANKVIARGQRNANKFLTSPTIATDGIAGPNTRRQCGRVLQHALNREYGCGLAVDGIVGEKTKAALKNRTVRKGDKSYLVLAAKILYQCSGKDKGLKYSRAYGSGLVKTAGKEKIVEKDLLSLL